MREHQLVQIDYRCYCSLCEWSWRHPPQEKCPGVKRYSYGSVPEHLVTFTELRRRKLKPGGPSVGAYRRARPPRDYLYFYDLNAAQPRRKPTERQREAIAKMRAALVARHTCDRCHWYDYTHGHDRQRGITIVRIGEEERRYCARCRDQEALEQTMHALLASNTPFVILDTETTGLPHHKHFQVVEVAVLDGSGSIVFHALIKPDISMPVEAKAVHGITDAMLVDAPHFAGVWPQLARLLSDHEIYCYNAAFDCEAILCTAARYGLEIPDRMRDHKRWHCMMLEFARYHSDYSPYWKSWQWQPLDIACAELDVEDNGFHRAVGDALNCLGIMRKLAERSGTHPLSEAQRLLE